MSRGGPVALLVALAACGGRAPPLLASHAATDPSLARRPAAGELQLHIGQTAAHQSSSGWLGVAGAGASWGAPPIGPFGTIAARLEIPAIETRAEVRIGSALVAVGIAENLPLGRALDLGVVVDVGLFAPSLGGDALRVAGNVVAVRAFDSYVGLSLPLTIRPLGLSVVFWSAPFARENVELAFAPREGAVVLRGGYGFATEGEPARSFGGIGLRLDRSIEMGAFGVLETEGPARGAIFGLSARWSPPTEATRSAPWEGADARVLHESELRGRDLESLAVPGKITVIEFGASWCVPCREARPRLEQLARSSDVAVRMIDVDESPEFTARYEVALLPTFVVIGRTGKVLRRVISLERVLAP
jgi:thiol-disulfide isomerase/thioredoxin